jgi:hypothetical protein
MHGKDDMQAVQDLNNFADTAIDPQLIDTDSRFLSDICLPKNTHPS